MPLVLYSLFLSFFIPIVLVTFVAGIVLVIMKAVKNKILLGILCGVSFLLLLFFSLYLSRNAVLHYFADRRIASLAKDYDLDIQYKSMTLDGCNTIALEGFTVVPHKRDTLLVLQSLNVRLGFWSMLRGKPDVRNVRLDGLDIQFIKQDSLANYDFLFRNSKKDKEFDEKQGPDYKTRAQALLDLLFGVLPQNGYLTRVHIEERKDDRFVTFNLSELRVKENHFGAVISLREDSLVQDWKVAGELNPTGRRLYASLSAPKHEQITLPYVNRRFGADVKCDSLIFSLAQDDGPRGEVRVSGKAEVSGLSVFHKRLSPEVVNLNRGQLSYCLNISKQAVELDSASQVRFNALTFHPYARAERIEQGTHKHLWHFTVAVRKPWFPAQELFGSLPAGLFENLQGLRTRGQLAYRFFFDVDFSRLDNLKLESALDAKDFHIEGYGQTNLSKMSGEFMYTAYENGQPVRTFPIGPSWAHFTPLDSISPLLQMSVMQSEDGAFFYHHGFLPDAMREALIYDLKVRRFARGGSTISMQLVKNVFLNRNKNIARKLEEALIVWLIENGRLTSKARMYEVYLNIAEWGPLIYGAHEAAAFYFNKLPSQLTAEECIFLASIIPKPKHFRNSFTATGQLKDNQAGYFRLIAGRLVRKGLLTEAEGEAIRPIVELKGAAKDFFRTDSIK